MSRSETTETHLFGGHDTKIWVTKPLRVLFEKGDVKFVLKIVEFDYDNAEDHVLVDIQSNHPTDLLETGVKIFKQNDITKPIIALLCLDKRELLRRTGAHSGRDALLLQLVQTLESLVLGV
jgi:hypothetical protein